MIAGQKLSCCRLKCGNRRGTGGIHDIIYATGPQVPGNPGGFNVQKHSVDRIIALVFPFYAFLKGLFDLFSFIIGEPSIRRGFLQHGNHLRIPVFELEIISQLIGKAGGNDDGCPLWVIGYKTVIRPQKACAFHGFIRRCKHHFLTPGQLFFLVLGIAEAFTIKFKMVHMTGQDGIGGVCRLPVRVII